MVNAGPGPPISMRLARTCAVMCCWVVLCPGDLPDVLKARTDFLLRELSGTEILAGGGLTGMPYPSAQSESPSVAHLDGILSSTSGSSVRHRRILSLVYLLAGHLDKAGQELQQLSLEVP